jgi:hypothetical protein
MQIFPLTYEHFGPLKRDPETREIINFDAYCRGCKRALNNDRYATDEKFRTRARKRAAAWKARTDARRLVDPVFDAEYMARRRKWDQAAKQRAKQRATSVVSAPPPSSGHGPNMPAQPLARIIDAWAEREELDDATVAEFLGVTDRRFREWRHPGVCTRLEIADRCLLALDLNWFDVWSPEEYPEVAKMWEGE